MLKRHAFLDRSGMLIHVRLPPFQHEYVISSSHPIHVPQAYLFRAEEGGTKRAFLSFSFDQNLNKKVLPIELEQKS